MPNSPFAHRPGHLPPKSLHTFCFSFLLGIAAVPREIDLGGKQGAQVTKHSQLQTGDWLGLNRVSQGGGGEGGGLILIPGAIPETF